MKVQASRAKSFAAFVSPSLLRQRGPKTTLPLLLDGEGLWSSVAPLGGRDSAGWGKFI